MRFFLSGFILFLSNSVYAFPGNIRHGYPNCTACHLSPSGAGVLTPYGRELSREIQSTYGHESESAFLAGTVPLPEWLDAGGDLRYIQIVEDHPSTVSGRSFWMQADVEAGVHLGKFAAVGTLGWKGNSEGLVDDASILSRRHYFMFNVNDPITIRGGRFYPMFGLMQAEHEDATRAPLGFDEGGETYNLEFSNQSERGSFFITPIFGKIRGDQKPDEKGFAISQNFTVAGNSRVGFSGLFGKEFDQPNYRSRIILGSNAVVNLSKTVFWMAELDFERRKLPVEGAETGIYAYQKLSYEPVQGFILSGRQDLARSVMSDPRTSVISLGPVIDWYPRPHFDFQLAMSRLILPGSAPDFWIYTGLIHIYL